MTVSAELNSAAQPNDVVQTEMDKPIRYSFRQQARYDPASLPQIPIPDFTIKDLLTAISKHCFERSALHASLYVIQDVVLMSAAFYAATYIDPFVKSLNFSHSPIDPAWLSFRAQQQIVSITLWSLYQFCQGLFFTGIWMNAHECGHQAFSTSKTLNNVVGFVLHSWVLVPYHAWRISHAKHHAGCGHMTRDEVYVPRSREERGLLPLRPPDKNEHVLNVPGEKTVEPPVYYNDDMSWSEWLVEVLEDAPLFNLCEAVAQQLFGWQMYLLANASGQSWYAKGTNHFSPNSKIFDSRHRWQTIASVIGVAVMIGGLIATSYVAPGGK